jgi:hypothetical protein
VVVSFTGNPSKVNSSSWAGTDWQPGTQLNEAANNYVSVATFAPDENGNYRRQKKYFRVRGLVVLDDVGERSEDDGRVKVGMDRITLQPTYLLETSPGNFHVGYVLSEPITETATADRLYNGCSPAG